MACFSLLFSGDGGIRTPDLCLAKAALSQLSYAPLTADFQKESPQKCVTLGQLLSGTEERRNLEILLTHIAGRSVIVVVGGRGRPVSGI